MEVYNFVRNNIFFICGWLVGAGTVGLAVILKYLISEIKCSIKEKKDEKGN